MSIHTVNWTTKSGKQSSAVRVNYKDETGKRRSKQFRTKREALAWLQAGHFPARNSTARSARTFAEVADDWIAACTRGRDGGMPLEPSVIAGYKSYLKNWLIPEIGAEPITTIDRARVRRLRDWLLEPQTQLARATAKKILNIARGVLRHALDECLITADPAYGVTIKLAAGRHKDQSSQRLKVHTREQMRVLLDLAAAKVRSKDQRTAIAWSRYRPLLLLLVYGGLRVSEARGLMRDAIDVSAGTVEIRQRADRYGNIGPPKSSAGYRTIVLHRSVIDELDVYLRSHKHDLVFPSRTGCVLPRENLDKRMWAPLQEEAGVPVLGLHAIRHFYASRLMELGASGKQLQTLMGHHAESFTRDVYGHLLVDLEDAQRDRRLAEQMLL